MKDFFRNMKVSYLLAAILYIAFGLVLLIWPKTTGDIICLIFGLILLVYGAITIISFFVHDSRQGVYRFELVLGIVAAALGLLFLLNPSFVLNIFPVILGIYIVVDAILNLKRALDLKQMEYGRWWIALILALVAMALGLLILIRPGFIADFIIMVIGGVLIYNGLADLWGIFMVGRVGKAYKEKHPIVIDPIDIE